MSNDQILAKVEHFFRNYGTVTVRRDRYGYSIFSGKHKVPVARMRLTDTDGYMEVLWWSHRDCWEPIGDFGGVVLLFDEALEYIGENRPGCFHFSPF